MFSHKYFQKLTKKWDYFKFLHNCSPPVRKKKIKDLSRGKQLPLHGSGGETAFLHFNAERKINIC